ncbi:MAG TPA: chemotaxis protein CheR [Firmicutes bacterium]|jgi:chemotaxis protein methyltransferase CheR|nr:chemotaxis protein CheR [Bacillota bacterium]
MLPIERYFPEEEVVILDYATFKKMAAELTQIDLNSYKSQQMDRRINSLMSFWNLQSYDEFYDLLRKDPKRYKDFVKKLTINVSEFFRNAERFHELWQSILPELLKKPQIRIWSAGCSDGAEPYTIAIILHELQAQHRARIIASDVDRVILEKAKEAVYALNEVKSVPEELLPRYFDMRDSFYVLKQPIKDMVEFRAQNLLVDEYEENFDLIVCRNVVIYFTEDAKIVLYQKFLKALNPGGYLMVGGTEPILAYRQMGFENALTSFYRKPI